MRPEIGAEMKHLRLTGGGGDHWVVLICDAWNDPDPKEIGTVTRNRQPTGGWGRLWTARDVMGYIHGDRYLDRWGAAKQLALGLGLGTKVQGL